MAKRGRKRKRKRKSSSSSSSKPIIVMTSPQTLRTMCVQVISKQPALILSAIQYPLMSEHWRSILRMIPSSLRDPSWRQRLSTFWSESDNGDRMKWMAIGKVFSKFADTTTTIGRQSRKKNTTKSLCLPCWQDQYWSDTRERRRLSVISDSWEQVWEGGSSDYHFCYDWR